MEKKFELGSIQKEWIDRMVGQIHKHEHLKEKYKDVHGEHYMYCKGYQDGIYSTLINSGYTELEIEQALLKLQKG